MRRKICQHRWLAKLSLSKAFINFSGGYLNYNQSLWFHQYIWVDRRRLTFHLSQSCMHLHHYYLFLSWSLRWCSLRLVPPPPRKLLKSLWIGEKKLTSIGWCTYWLSTTHCKCYPPPPFPNCWCWVRLSWNLFICVK